MIGFICLRWMRRKALPCLPALALLAVGCAAREVSGPGDVLWTGRGGGVSLKALCPDERQAAREKETPHRMRAVAACYLNLLTDRDRLPRIEADAAAEVALSWIRRARHLGDENEFGHVAEGFLYMLKSRSAGSEEARRADVGRAVEQLREALRARPQSAAAHRLLGQAFALLGRHEAAEGEFRLLIESGLGDAASYAWMGYVFFRQGKEADAAAMWKKAARLGGPADAADWAAERLR